MTKKKKIHVRNRCLCVFQIVQIVEIIFLFSIVKPSLLFHESATYWLKEK